MKLNIYQNIPVLPFLIESFHDLFSFGRILLVYYREFYNLNGQRH